MVSLGYALSSEEHRPADLVRYAREAEDSGFSFALISDHFHPWTDRQGQSPFVWSVLGAIAQTTSALQVGTGVTCPILRIHPAIIAQAAATTAALFAGRFFLGVGSGENLNEHVTGEAWPMSPVRLEMLGEAVEVLRKLWRGKETTHRGTYFTVDEARIYSLPDQPPPIFIAAKGKRAIRLAGQLGDGLIGLAPQRELTVAFEQAGGNGKPRVGQIAVCWAQSEDEGKRTVHEWWPNHALSGRLSSELKTPSDIEAATQPVGVEAASNNIVVGPDASKFVDAIRKMTDAGYDHVYLHQIGPQQDEFMRFTQRDVLPQLGATPARLASRAHDAVSEGAS